MINDQNEIEKLKLFISEYFLKLEKRISKNDIEILKLLEKLERERQDNFSTKCIDTQDIQIISYLDN